MNISIRSEIPDDIAMIRKVNAAAFDTNAEAELVDRLRDAGATTLSKVAVLKKKMVGHILFSPVVIESKDSGLHVVGLGPMSVLPEHQRQGVGSKLVVAGLELCMSQGQPAVVVLGHPEFYPRFGFVPSRQYSITCEYDVPPEVFMIKELRQGSLAGHAGIAKYHQLFNEL
jgi:putative acetyltransferase